jgi:hypothetical protein
VKKVVLPTVNNQISTIHTAGAAMSSKRTTNLFICTVYTHDDANHELGFRMTGGITPHLPSSLVTLERAGLDITMMETALGVAWCY